MKLTAVRLLFRYDLPEKSEDKTSEDGFCCQSFSVKVWYNLKYSLEYLLNGMLWIQ